MTSASLKTTQSSKYEKIFPRYVIIGRKYFVLKLQLRSLNRFLRSLNVILFLMTTNSVYLSFQVLFTFGEKKKPKIPKDPLFIRIYMKLYLNKCFFSPFFPIIHPSRKNIWVKIDHNNTLEYLQVTIIFQLLLQIIRALLKYTIL